MRLHCHSIRRLATDVSTASSGLIARSCFTAAEQVFGSSICKSTSSRSISSYLGQLASGRSASGSGKRSDRCSIRSTATISEPFPSQLVQEVQQVAAGDFEKCAGRQRNLNSVRSHEVEGGLQRKGRRSATALRRFSLWPLCSATRVVINCGADFRAKRIRIYQNRQFSTMADQIEGAVRGKSAKGQDGAKAEPFAPKRVLVLTKFSRLEFEKRRHKELTDDELIRDLKARGSDYQSLLHHHNIHTKNRDLVVETLRKAGLETRLVDRFDYTDANVEWADVIFTVGGDGTFLMAASKVRCRDKPVIGINSDPSRSVGYLCLSGDCTEDFPKALQKLLNGQFRWQWRQRIRVSVQGEHAFDLPLELHNQQLQYPEYRFIDCINEEHKPTTPATPTHVDGSAATSDIPPVPTKPPAPIRILPIRSLNEVFIGESLSSRVSYYEISIDGSPRTKVKSSGVTICTGTGSTSWSFNISKVTPQCVKRILEIVQAKTNKEVGVKDEKLIEEVTSEFNDSLIFDPSHARMAYTIRDPVFFGTTFNSRPRGFAKRIEIRSRMFDACIVIDGSMSFTFNDGATAVLEILEQDGLKTVAID